MRYMTCINVLYMCCGVHGGGWELPDFVQKEIPACSEIQSKVGLPVISICVISLFILLQHDTVSLICSIKRLPKAT